MRYRRPPAILSCSYHPPALSACCDFFSFYILGIHHAEVAHGDVDPAIDTHADAVGGVVRTTFLIMQQSGNVFNQSLRLAICLAVTIGIGEHAEMHAGHYAGVRRDHRV